MPQPAATVTENRKPLLREISWTGLIGSAIGVIFPSQSAVYVLVSPGDASRLAAIPLCVIVACYVPALWVSLFGSERRQRVYRGVLIVSLPLVLVGVILYGPAFSTLLLIPSTLLAIAGGLVFQGARKGGR